MTSLARIRPSLRRAAFVAVLGALMVPATAGAAVHAHASAKKKKVKLPVVTSVRPMEVQIGQTLEIRGKYFIRGRNKNSVVFKRDGGRAVFVKAGVGTTKLLRVKVPTKLEREFTKQGSSSMPTRFRVRVLTKKLGKRFTTASRSPVISAAPAAPAPAPLAPASPAQPAPLAPAAPDAAPTQALPEGDCDADGQVNRVDADDDNDLLSDGVEAGINSVLVAKYGPGIAQMNPCSADTDEDGVEDGYEYRSAKDLNDDEYQQPNTFLPYPAKKPYANPLFKDADIDYDGDTLTLQEEYSLWSRFGPRTLSPLNYSDGEQYSIFRRIPSGPDAGRREPTLLAATYSKRTEFINWASAHGYRTVELQDAPPWWDVTERNTYGLFDVDRDGTESDAELYYNDIDGDGYLSDNERDEDADGLTNYDESHGRVLPTYWNSCYEGEMPYHIGYEGTDLADADSDGDGVRDGADDQDHDDIPNLDELSRIAASGLDDRKTRDCEPKEAPGNVSVGGGPLPDGAVVVTFQNELGNRDVAQMTWSSAGLTGGTSPAVNVTTTRPGGGGVDEQQTVTITGGPTGGGFTLTFGGKTTPQLAYNAVAATVEAELKKLVPQESNHPDAFGRVNPFNPCLPYTKSRTCPKAVNDSTGAPFDGSPNWYALQ
jgi:hypothetical protein